MRACCIALIALSLLGCSNPRSPRVIPESTAASAEAYQEAADRSGEKAAGVELEERLRRACHLGPRPSAGAPNFWGGGVFPEADEAQSAFPLRMENAEECIRSRVVTAFEADEGETYCGQLANISSFIDCIVSGAYASLVARNLGIISLSGEDLWNNRIEPNGRINDMLLRKALETCQRSSQLETDKCAEELALTAMEISPGDIVNCPTGPARGTCIGKTGGVHFVRTRLLFIF